MNENKCCVETVSQEYLVQRVKQYRKDFDEVLFRLKSYEDSSREHGLAVTKVQEAIMWLGMELKRLGEANPYPHSYDPSSPIIDPTADGLKL